MVNRSCDQSGDDIIGVCAWPDNLDDALAVWLNALGRPKLWPPALVIRRVLEHASYVQNHETANTYVSLNEHTFAFTQKYACYTYNVRACLNTSHACFVANNRRRNGGILISPHFR